MNERPWLSHYDDGVPHTLEPYPAITILDLLRDSARENPEDAAFFFMGSSISWREIELKSNAFASALQAQGVGKGDRVAVLMPNSPQMIIAEFGIWKAGGIAVLLNPLYTEHELEHALRDSEAETAVVLTLFYDKLNAIRQSTPLKRLITTSIKEYLPPLKRLLFTLVKEKRGGHKIVLRTDDLAMNEMIANHAQYGSPEVTVAPEDPALFLFSGGTTGKPKCVIGRHEALIMTGMQSNAWFDSAFDKERVVIMLNLPLFHVFAQVAVMASGLVRRSP
jgi:long-chain acyl-CoA synthetase